VAVPATGVEACGASIGWDATFVAGDAGLGVGVASVGEAAGDTSDSSDRCVGEAAREAPGVAVAPRHAESARSSRRLTSHAHREKTDLSIVDLHAKGGSEAYPRNAAVYH
jgi:hypothetical protein